MKICKVCDRPEPREYCWDGLDIDCPFSKPPRGLNVNDLWPMIIELNRRVGVLEQCLIVGATVDDVMRILGFKN